MKKIVARVKRQKRVVMMAAFALMALAALPSAAFASPPSQALDFSGGSGFSFSVMDVINSAWSFIGQFNTYVVLVTALILIPTLVGFIIWLISKAPKFRKSS